MIHLDLELAELLLQFRKNFIVRSMRFYITMSCKIKIEEWSFLFVGMDLLRKKPTRKRILIYGSLRMS